MLDEIAYEKIINDLNMALRIDRDSSNARANPNVIYQAVIQCLEKINLLEKQIETLIIANDLYRSQEDKYKKLEADANYFNDR